MSTGYIYVLQNKAYGANVIKIGLTSRTPDLRAREIYAGATGVPLPFDVASAYSVADCKRAEKLVHRLLKAYRLNNRREFFRVTPSVAVTVVRDTCDLVNTESGVPPPSEFEFPPLHRVARNLHAAARADDDTTEFANALCLKVDQLKDSPVGSSSLTEEQTNRARVLYHILKKLYPVACNKWLEGFTRDKTPERDLNVWEHIAKAYLTLDHADEAPDGYRLEAFELLLQRSWSPTLTVISDAKLRYFSKETAKRLLDAYELKPKPIVVSTSPNRRGRAARHSL
ncbi:MULTISPECIES: GIY-YIG nuclease family protein [Cupriavidus]